ncbi:MAG: hypothetical protein CW335_02460 [Clostridiales bacterium]|nr:hypothetical protein [Clostridiales bacterium]
MQFGTFIWPNDPEIFRMKFARKVEVEAANGGTWTVNNIARMGRTFECEGVFFGSNAYNSIRALASLHIAGHPAALIHPQWDNTTALLSEMEVTEGPGENLLHYKLTFIELPPA